MNDKKILLLRICAPGFKDMIKGKTKWRYREVKKYWESRLLEKDGTPKTFDEVHIKNGYKEDSPMVIMEFKGNHGIFEYEGKQQFKLELGKVLEIKNYTSL